MADAFFCLFLSDVCLGKACYDKCKFKLDSSAADIRIGDLWGQSFSSNDEGVSAAITFTKRGDDVLTQSNCVLQKIPFEVAAEGQMKTAAKRNKKYNQMRLLLSENKVPISVCARLIISQKQLQRVRYLVKHPIKTFAGILKRIWKIK